MRRWVRKQGWARRWNLFKSNGNHRSIDKGHVERGLHRVGILQSMGSTVCRSSVLHRDAHKHLETSGGDGDGDIKGVGKLLEYMVSEGGLVEAFDVLVDFETGCHNLDVFAPR